MSEEAPLPIKTTSGSEMVSIDLELEFDHKKYILSIKSNDDSIEMKLCQSEDKYISYKRILNLKELKEISQFFSMINSCKDFAEHLKKLVEEKKLSLNKKMNKIDLCFTLDYFSKKQLIEISLFCGGEVSNNMEERVKKLENENIQLRKEIDELKKIIEPINKKYLDSFKINKHIFNNKSVIMNENEFDLIHLGIKSRLNKQVKELKKLYQATIDGDGPINFHSRCDGIPNTLILIKSAGNRRFGGFASQTWESTKDGKYKEDINAFLFSIDKQKLYPYIKDGKALMTKDDWGPTFGNSYSSIYIGANPIQEKQLHTNESNSEASYNFYGDKNALSEDGKASGIYASEIEVFQVILED